MLNIIIVFITAFLAGLAAFPLKNYNSTTYRMFLIFSGAFLFSITISHLIPDFFAHATISHAGIYVLAGFVFQQVLEYFTSGAEHGHLHSHSSDHSHKAFYALPFIIALVIHAFMEGIMLGREDMHDGGHQVPLIGIVLHKMPAAFALMTIVLCHYKNKFLPVVYLIVFALATPLGILLTKSWLSNGQEPWWWQAIYGIVIGNFLHISTTIVFESSTDHGFHLKRILVILLGVGAAVVVDFL